MILTNLLHISYIRRKQFIRKLYDATSPIEIIDWVNLNNFNLYNYSNDSTIGCFLEVDLDYPNEQHDLHDDYPLVGENKVAEKMMSEY